MACECIVLTLKSSVYGVWLDECGTLEIGEIDTVGNPRDENSVRPIHATEVFLVKNLSKRKCSQLHRSGLG